VRVIALGEHLAMPLHHAIEPTRHAHAEPAHPACQRAGVLRLDEQVHMVPLHRVVHQLEAVATRAPECLVQLREAAPRAQVPHALLHAPRDVHRKPRLQQFALLMPQAGEFALRLTPSTFALAAPGAKLEGALFHLVWALYSIMRESSSESQKC